jgi:integrase
MAYYTLYWRKDTGRYYYRTNNPDGTRSTGRSTGEKTKARANDYCHRLIAEGTLWQGTESTFESYIRQNHWFEPDCPYIADRVASGTKEKPGISDSYIKRLRLDLEKYLIPFFGKIKMRKIGPEEIRAFRVWLLDERKLANKTVNNAVNTLHIIMGWALDNNVIYRDPFRGVRQLKTDANPRDAFTPCEARRVLRLKWDEPVIWLYNLTAAVTGMRVCEVGALRDATVMADYLDVKDQWKKKIAPVKTKEKRKIPLPGRLRDLLMSTMGGAGFAFKNRSGDAPTHYGLAERHLNARMPPDVAAQKAERRLSFHSWRHFFNTWLLARNVPPAKVSGVLGHSVGAGSMTDLYAHWQAADFPEVAAAQEALLDILLPGNPNLEEKTTPDGVRYTMRRRVGRAIL